MAQPGDEAIWLWLGVAVLFVGAAFFAARGLRRGSEETRPYYWLVGAAAGIGGLAYLLSAVGVGATTVTAGSDRTVYLARYAGWLVASVLVLAALWRLADADGRTLGALVGLDALVVGLGAAGALATAPLAGLSLEATRLALWAGSVVALLALLGVVLRVLSPQAGRQPREVAVRFSVLRNLVVVVWLLYPLAWVVGNHGLGIVGLFVTAAAFLLLDLVAVVGFGLLLLRSDDVLAAA